MQYYITTPLFYVNDLPHIGSAYPTIAADFIAGHMLQRSWETYFLTGTDEHGQKIEKAAAANGMAPQQHCDRIVAEFQKLWDLLKINNDFFRRTSAEDHRDFVQDFFVKVQAQGDIYEGEYKGLYCVSCEDFWLEKDLVEENDKFYCPTHRAEVQEYSQKNYFFRLSKYQDALKQHLLNNPDFIAPEYRKNEVLSWIEEGLRDFPISRVGLQWGIDVPNDTTGQKIYVWFDALLGYISGLGKQREKIWADNTRITHIIGKDILRFHAVYWPCMLMSAGMPLPKKVFGHGFLTKDGMKMGKTLGNIIDPIALCHNYGAEAVKFYFLREIIFGKDGDYTDIGFIQRLNSDLANNLGNLLNRALKLISKYSDGVIPDLDIDDVIASNFAKLKEEFISDLDELSIHSALERIFRNLDEVNILINNVAPWQVLKQESIDEASKIQALKSLKTALVATYKAAILLAPIMPELATKILDNLGVKFVTQNHQELLRGVFALDQYDKDLSGLTVNPNPEPVFRRLEINASV